jgi:hypothetical protein
LDDELSGAGDTDDHYDEAHSLLGSEFKYLPSDLENHYKLYFSNRSKTVVAEARTL